MSQQTAKTINSPKSGQSGVTLVEILITIVLTVSFVTSAMAGFLNLQKRSLKMALNSEAQRILQGHADRIQALNYVDVTNVVSIINTNLSRVRITSTASAVDLTKEAYLYSTSINVVENNNQKVCTLRTRWEFPLENRVMTNSVVLIKGSDVF
ncbi:MAG: hypothetical protein SGI71_08980 [Verrucomicrobiota bacterium]|nr:hypothetical protein [Verrucomicrobiota bacterium]